MSDTLDRFVSGEVVIVGSLVTASGIPDGALSFLEKIQAIATWDLLLIPSTETITEEGTGVSAVINHGNGGDALQSTDSARPSFVTGSHGHPALRFNGSSDYLQGTLSGLDSTNGLEIFCVNSGGVDTSDAWFDGEPGTTTNGGLLFFRSTGGAPALRFKSGFDALGTTALNVWNLAHGYHTTLDRRVFLNGTQEGQSIVNVGTATLNNYRVGSLFQDVFFLQGDISFLALTNSVLQTAARAKMVSLLTAEYL